MREPRKGERVRHPVWGGGQVVARTVAGRVRVAFDGAAGLPRTLATCELELEDEPTAPAPASSDRSGSRGPRSSEPLIPDAAPAALEAQLATADAWQTLEALRLGVVPARGVREYTVARDAELASLAALFEAGRGCRILWGDYGTGKTHLLEAAEQLALEQGFATARLTLDPREQALHHPLRLYRHVADSLRTLDQATAGFEALFERLAESPDHVRPDGARASRFFSPYLHALRYGSAEDVGWLRDYVRGDNIEAEEVNRVLASLAWRGERVLKLSDFRTYGRMYVHLVGTLACWCSDAGARGLVLLFDEVERVDALGREDQHYAFEVLRHYAAVTLDPADLAFDPEALYKGGQTVHRALSLRFRETQPLATVFALTPLEEIRGELATLTRSSAYDVTLSPLGARLLPELLARIAAVYQRAYPGHVVPRPVALEIQARLAEAVDGGHDSFRDVVRAAVLLLDAARLGPAGRLAV